MTGSVELRAVSRTFPGPHPVEALQATDLTIGVGEFVALIGRSGSGKSTLLHILALLDRPTAGRYLIDEVETASMSDRRQSALRARAIGVVFQGSNLIRHRTAAENVAVALAYQRCPRRERTPRALRALDRVGLAGRQSSLPSTLSGGEQQRVAIARALVGNPALLLADEPTGNLDAATAESILRLFTDLHRDGQTLVVVTHDRQVAGRAQRVLRMESGVLTEESVGAP